MTNKTAMALLQLESPEQPDHAPEFESESALCQPEGKGAAVQSRPLVSIRRQEHVDCGPKVQVEEQQRLQAEVNLRDKEAMLILQSRMAIMAEMIANHAHQWRQRLNVLGLFAQDLELSYQAGNLTAEYLEKRVTQILHSISQMSQNLDCLRDFSKPESDKKIFQIHEPISWALSILEPTLKSAGIDVSVNAANDPVLTGYPTDIALVVINIIANARDALVERGVPNPKVIIVTATEGGKKLVTITDNAGGIADDIVDNIFAPYFSTNSAGTGLGLFMSKIVIADMNGSLTVRNVAGGAQFRIEL